jgi:hypothetical protein
MTTAAVPDWAAVVVGVTMTKAAVVGGPDGIKRRSCGSGAHP